MIVREGRGMEGEEDQIEATRWIKLLGEMARELASRVDEENILKKLAGGEDEKKREEGGQCGGDSGMMLYLSLYHLLIQYRHPPPHLPHLPTRQPSCYFYTSISLQFMDEKSALPANLTILTILTIRLIPAKFCTASYCPGPLPFLVPCLFQVQFIALLYLYEVS